MNNQNFKVNEHKLFYLKDNWCFQVVWDEPRAIR